MFDHVNLSVVVEFRWISAEIYQFSRMKGMINTPLFSTFLLTSTKRYWIMDCWSLPFINNFQILFYWFLIHFRVDIRHSLIGDASKRGISGGQRKRVNIGMELVACPTVLFLGTHWRWFIWLDEPTSGLDSTSSKEVCDALRTVARLGLTVITVIHQPRYEIRIVPRDWSV